MPLTPKSKFILILGLVSILAGCSTPYQPRGGFGTRGGYQDIPKGEDEVNVFFGANGFSSMQRAADFALLRCAELCVSHGRNFFEIQDNKFGSSDSPVPIPGVEYTHWSGNSSFSVTVPPSVATVQKPWASYLVKFLTDRPRDSSKQLIEAAPLIREIKLKYNL